MLFDCCFRRFDEYSVNRVAAQSNFTPQAMDCFGVGLPLKSNLVALRLGPPTLAFLSPQPSGHLAGFVTRLPSFLFGVGGTGFGIRCYLLDDGIASLSTRTRSASAFRRC